MRKVAVVLAVLAVLFTAGQVFAMMCGTGKDSHSEHSSQQAATAKSQDENCPTCATQTKGTKKADTESAKAVYACPMHPEVKMDKPGFCPKCGMKLVREEIEQERVEQKTKSNQPSSEHQHN